MQQGSHNKQLSQITPKNPTLIYDSGGHHSLQGKEIFQIYLKYIFGYLLEPMYRRNLVNLNYL
jgi:hypothetical protein